MENQSYDKGNMTTLIPDYVTPSTSTENVNVTHVFERYSWTEFLEVFCPVALSIDRYITPIWYLIGVTANFLSARIWLSKRMRTNNSSAIYLATLSITDMFFLLLHIMQELKYAWDVNTLKYPVICEGYFLLSMVAQYLSPMLVLGFTVERWIAVCHPFQKEKFCTTSRALKVVCGFFAASIILCSMQAYFWTYNQENDECEVRLEATAGDDASLWSIWTWVTEMLIFLVVPLVILIFNILVIREVRKLSQSGAAMLPGQMKSGGHTSRATTAMLLSVSFYVIFTTLPATLVYVLVSEFPEGSYYLTDDQIRTDPVWENYRIYLTGRKVVEEICLSHYACNFFLYIITGVHFRRALVDLLHCRRFGSIKGGTYSEISNKTNWQQTHTTKV